MKLAKNTMKHFIGLLFLLFLVGTFAWALLEKILSSMGYTFHWAIGPLSVDLFAVQISAEFNPGSLFGFIAGLILFFLL